MSVTVHFNCDVCQFSTSWVMLDLPSAETWPKLTLKEINGQHVCRDCEAKITFPDAVRAPDSVTTVG